MNTAIFKSVMRQILETNTAADRAVFAEIMALAYSAATVGFSGTTFGARLIKGDTQFLQKCINDALDANFADSTRDVNVSAYNLMAVGFMGYWASARFTPIPFTPTMVSTVKGAVVVVPGSQSPFGGNLFYSFVLGDPEAHLNALCMSIQMFHQTITGTITGLTSNGSAITLPWVGII